MLRELRTAAGILVLFTVLCGGIYPLLVTTLGRLIAPSIDADLIARDESDPRRFWPRPSATAKPHDALSSSGSNLGPSNPALATAVQERVAKWRAADAGHDNARPLPIDLVTTSGSGLDPHISLDGARYQAPRVARVRALSVAQVDAAIDAVTEGRLLGLFGEPRVNVARLNRQLERLAP